MALQIASKTNFALKLPAATQSAIAQTLRDASAASPVPLPPNLEQLAATAPNPLPLLDLAPIVGCSFDLLDRVSSRRQPLPGWFVGPIAAALGVQAGEVRAPAGQVLDLPVRVEQAETAYPPDRLLGDPLYPVALRPTVEPVFPDAP